MACASFFLVGLAHAITRVDSFGKARVEVFRLGDAGAICTAPAEIRESVRDRLFQAIQRAGEHQGESIFARSMSARKDHRMWKALPRQHLTKAMDGFRVAEKIRKRHSQLLAFGSWLLAKGQKLTAKSCVQ